MFVVGESRRVISKQKKILPFFHSLLLGDEVYEEERDERKRGYEEEKKAGVGVQGRDRRVSPFPFTLNRLWRNLPVPLP